MWFILRYASKFSCIHVTLISAIVWQHRREIWQTVSARNARP